MGITFESIRTTSKPVLYISAVVPFQSRWHDETPPNQNSIVPELIVRMLAIVGLAPLVWTLSGCQLDKDPPDVPGSEPVAILTAAHAHNDYAHERPLFDALGNGFRSIEVDVYLVHDTLFVAHDSVDIRSDRTIESLYLDPLLDLFQSSEYAVPLILLVDIKTEAAPSARALNTVLRRYAAMLTEFGPDSLQQGFVSVIVSGNRDQSVIAEAQPRYAAIDGRPADLVADDGGARYDSFTMPLISASWESLFDWRGDGPMALPEYKRLLDLAASARSSGRELRFWATPDEQGPARAAVWDTLLSAGATLINTDDLSGLREYLLKRPRR